MPKAWWAEDTMHYLTHPVSKEPAVAKRWHRIGSVAVMEAPCGCREYFVQDGGEWTALADDDCPACRAYYEKHEPWHYKKQASA
jgi:hypothetical protein